MPSIFKKITFCTFIFLTIFTFSSIPAQAEIIFDQAQINNFGFDNFKYLPVPYFNQCLEPDGSFSPSNLTKNGKEACRYMCSAATMVMIAGYFNKLSYDQNDAQTLKKYMYSDSNQNISDSCGENQGGAFGLIAKETDQFTQGLSDCDQGSGYGMAKYAQKLGLFTHNLEINLESIKAAINRGNPVIISSPSHILLIKGYVNDKLIVNDPYRNLSIDNHDYDQNGKDALYDLSGIIYKSNPESFIYAIEVAPNSLAKPKFQIGQKVRNTVDSLSVRPEPCSPERITRIPLNTEVEIIEEAKISETCQYGLEFKVWYKIRTGDGLEGYVIENYLELVQN